MKFIDEIEFTAASGNGGDGCVSFRRERFIPRGGPNGGDGGRGGDLIFEATPRRNTLIDFRRNKVYRADNGRPGEGQQKTGRSGEDLVLLVPVGTVFHDADTGEVLHDLDEPGARWVLPGGRGGAGNVHFKSGRNRTPRKATPGHPGVEIRIRLELKLLADVGLLGFPNAGKSTLISRISAARPRVADYPFTTLVPSLGVVDMGDGDSFVVADIPGLIEGASEGVGLGHQFLRHIERCQLYLHMVAPDAPQGEPVELLQALDKELGNYNASLLDRPQIVVLTKADLMDEATREQHVEALKAASGAPVFAISSVSGMGIRALKRAVWDHLKGLRESPSSDDMLP